ncbi:MAG: HNH endonuclease family protein, partial [Bacteroidales bacterium]|nr:HNH endonuclease family protein [Bacteroidales bacterium]
WCKIDCGCSVPNFVFNFYDFITWRENPAKYPKFEFSYRTSVEHFYPQNPMPRYDDLKDRGLDSFGNLCLISRSMNSKFSNNMPKAKLANFGMIEEVRNGLSLKLLEMMDIVKRSDDWGETQIREFDKLAKEKILEALKLGC